MVPYFPPVLATLLFPLLQGFQLACRALFINPEAAFASSVTGFSTLHDIDVFRCYVACGISDNLAGDKRRIALIISVLQQTIAARSYEKTYDLAGIPMS